MGYQRQNEIICFSLENIPVISLFTTINSLIIRITYLRIAKKCPEIIKILPCTIIPPINMPEIHITNNKSTFRSFQEKKNSIEVHLNVSRSAWAFKISMKEGWRSTALFTIFVCIWLNRLRNKKVSEWINAWKQHVIAADRGATLESHWFCCFLSSLNIVNRFEKVQFTVINWKLIPLQQLSEKKNVWRIFRY